MYQRILLNNLFGEYFVLGFRGVWVHAWLEGSAGFVVVLVGVSFAGTAQSRKPASNIDPG